MNSDLWTPIAFCLFVVSAGYLLWWLNRILNCPVKKEDNPYKRTYIRQVKGMPAGVGMMFAPVPTDWAKFKDPDEVRQCFIGYMMKDIVFMVPSKYWTMVQDLLFVARSNGYPYVAHRMGDASVTVMCPKHLDIESSGGITVLPRNEDLAYLNTDLLRDYALSKKSESLVCITNDLKRHWENAIMRGAQELVRAREPFALRVDDMAMMPSVCAMVASLGASVATYRGYPDIDLIFFERVDACDVDTVQDSSGVYNAANG